MPVQPAREPRAQLLERMEANIRSYCLLLRYADGGRCAATEEMVRVSTPIRDPFVNVVVDARLAPEDAERRIRETLAHFRGRSVPMWWIVGPLTRPASLPRMLQRCGLAVTSRLAGMAARIVDAPAAVPAPADLQIRQVVAEDQREAWIELGSTTFDCSAATMRALACTALDEAAAEVERMRAYLAYLDGIPVALAALHLGAGVGGLYCVGTLRPFRRRGIGTAITLHAMREAEELGCRTAILQASRMGEPMYRKLGFKEVCRYTVLLGRE